MCDPCIVIEISQQESKSKQQDVPIKKCNQDDSDSQGKKFFHRYGYYPAYIVSETLVQSKSSSSSIDSHTQLSCQAKQQTIIITHGKKHLPTPTNDQA